MFNLTTMQREEQITPTAYQVGVFALVQHRSSYLIVRPRKPLLPGGSHSLPGLLLSVSAGGNVVELHLRRALLSQVGIAVSDLRLVGSHAARGAEVGNAEARLNMIFGTEYCSGILNPQPMDLLSAEWIPRDELGEYSGAPEWLQTAIREFETTILPATITPQPHSPLRFGRRR